MCKLAQVVCYSEASTQASKTCMRCLCAGFGLSGEGENIALPRDLNACTVTLIKIFRFLYFYDTSAITLGDCVDCEVQSYERLSSSVLASCCRICSCLLALSPMHMPKRGTHISGCVGSCKRVRAMCWVGAEPQASGFLTGKTLSVTDR